MATPKTCSREGCDAPALSRGLCSKHYAHARYHGLLPGGVRQRSRAGQCSVEGCAGKIFADRLCAAHYTQRRRGRGFTTPRNQLSVGERLLEQVEYPPGGCWVWTGSRNEKGYGLISVGNRRLRVHRVAYEQWVGPIPEGLQVDHAVCGNPPCLNPEHLRVVTNKQNIEHRVNMNKNSTSKVRGVSFHRATGKWRATVKHDYVQHYLGLFDTVEAAEAAVVAKRNQLFTHNDRDG